MRALSVSTTVLPARQWKLCTTEETAGLRAVRLRGARLSAAADTVRCSSSYSRWR
eukprot:COSAG06_NODE_18336_length_892_cov_1.865069_2_plen_54_part_01